MGMLEGRDGFPVQDMSCQELIKIPTNNWNSPVRLNLHLIGASSKGMRRGL